VRFGTSANHRIPFLNCTRSAARSFAGGWLGGKHGAGVPGSRGVENAGSDGKRRVWWKTRGLGENVGSGGKRGVWWKTRGLMWKTRGTTIFRQNMHLLRTLYVSGMQRLCKVPGRSHR